MKISILLLFFASMGVGCAAQQPVDSLQTDSLELLEEGPAAVDTDSLPKPERAKTGLLRRFFKSDYPNPKKAVLLSLILPGAGQIYNKKLLYVRLPVIYGSLGFMGYLIYHNTDQYRTLRQAYLYRVDGDPATNDEFDFYSANDLKRLRDKARKNMELSYIGFFAIYTLQAVEAFVTAHLLTFDVSDDLSMHIQPGLQGSIYRPLPALSLNVRFKPISSPPLHPLLIP